MKFPRPSIASIGFITLVLGLNFGLLRAIFSGNGKGLALLPAFWLTPMVDTLLIALFRLRKPDRRTRGALGFFVTGTVATLGVYAYFLLSIGDARVGVVMDLLIELVLKPILQFAGPTALNNFAGQLVFGILSDILLPTVILSIPPLLVALLGRSLARRYWKPRHLHDLPVPAE